MATNLSVAEKPGTKEYRALYGPRGEDAIIFFHISSKISIEYVAEILKGMRPLGLSLYVFKDMKEEKNLLN